MTITQLEAFVLVARLGSVTAAARTLGVSEPAVSSSLAALRRQLGDNLVERGQGGAMVLTEGGRRLVGIASQMVALAADATDAIRRAQGAPERLRVVATATVAESVAPALMAAFSARGGVLETSLGLVSGEEAAAVLHERLADVALGPRVTGDAGAGLECVALFRYRLMVVVAPGHPLAGRRAGWAELAAQRWLVDPDAADPTSAVAAMLGRLRVPEGRVSVFPSQAAAWVAAAEGGGVAPAIAHLVGPELARGSLVTVDAPGTPVELLWYATALPAGRRSPAADALLRFIATPVATQAMHAPLRGVPPSRFRPPVYVTLWS